MKQITVLALLALALCCQGLPTSKIIGGSDASEGKYPYHVAIERGTTKNGVFRRSAICGGAIIHKYWILTAAHCLIKNDEADIYKIYVGTYDFKKLGPQHELDYFIQHEKFNQQINNCDIAVLKTKEPIEFNRMVYPIALPQSNPVDLKNERAIFAGFGIIKDKESYDYPTKLQKFTVSLYDHELCHIHNRVTENEICAFNRKGEGICSGDSGGALIYNRTVIGVASYVRGCAFGNPDVYTNVFQFLDWIRVSTNGDVKV